jgi:hypothetical protein
VLCISEVPPGRYTSQGLVRTCPQGFYRELFRDFDDPIATTCLPCNPGITTDGAGAGFQYLCNMVLPGYGVSAVFNVTGPESVPALPYSNSSGLPSATVCDFGFYSLGGYCGESRLGLNSHVQ